MAYKLIINNKTFDAIDADGRCITLSLKDKDDFDVIFFKKWQDRIKNSASKKDYIEDVDFVKITEKGMLVNCFPILDENETKVNIYYDLKVIL